MGRRLVLSTGSTFGKRLDTATMRDLAKLIGLRNQVCQWIRRQPQILLLPRPSSSSLFLRPNPPPFPFLLPPPSLLPYPPSPLFPPLSPPHIESSFPFPPPPPSLLTPHVFSSSPPPSLLCVSVHIATFPSFNSSGARLRTRNFIYLNYHLPS